MNAAAAATGEQHLSLKLGSGGAFTVALNDKPWLAGGVVMVGNKTTQDGSLVLSGTAQGSGTDALGAFTSVTQSWAAATTRSDVLFETTFKEYAADPGVLVFTQSFPRGLSETELQTMTLEKKEKNLYNDSSSSSSSSSSSRGSLESLSVFPGFFRGNGKGPSDNRHFFAYRGVFPGIYHDKLVNYAASHQGGAPLVIYDGGDDTLPMMVLSPLDHYKAHHMCGADSGFFGAGVKATVTSIPPGWTQSFVLSAGAGINAGMMAWGDRMLKWTGKPRADWFRDETHSTIGFWTDNGGYYHYSLGTGEGKTYEEVLPKVKAYHDSIGVPFGHWQFDSWFYPKDGKVNAGGGGGAVTNWTADPTIFPHGMAYIQDKLGLPTVMHNRQWSIHSDYIKNLPQFKWWISKYAVPEDPVAFFTWFFQQQQGWGLSMYEQDWMCTEYDGVSQLQTNVSLADLWLLGMATGAERSNRTVQYCMPYPNDVLAAAALPAVSNARATGDYFHAHDQWAVGGTSLFYWAIGVIPFKDGFYSSTNKQIGGQTVGPEENPDREAIMATLSCGMVGAMDGINLLNKSRVMTTCRADGKVLRPDRPISTVDDCFRGADKSDPTCHVYSTHSDVQGLGRAHYYYNDEGGAALTPAQVYLNATSNYAVYNWYTGEVVPLAASVSLAAGYENHNYAVVTPVVAGGWTLLGEVDKYASLSTQRFAKVVVASDGLTATVVGVANENVSVCAAKCTSGSCTKTCKVVAFTAAGEKEVAFN
eukprot:UC1_evm2s915